jgi:hypothetical protein
MLRRIEYQPSLAPQTLAAIRSLERARQRNASKLLEESRALVETQQQPVVKEDKPAPEVKEAPKEPMFAPSMPLSEITAPPPISTVLHDIYQDETRASN